MPNISVITPVYNGELFLKQAIDSLLAQSFHDWELIVVDDGSQDGTPQILEQYTDGRIKRIWQQNSGESCARNVGLQYASGEYIAFLDADDFYFPNALEDLSTFLDTHPNYDVVFSDGDIVDEQDNIVMRLTEVRPGIYTGKILEKVVNFSSVVTVPVCTMTRRSKIVEHSVQFDQNVVIGPDWDFWIQLAVHVEFGYLDKITCKYRIHTTNISRITGSQKRKKDELYRRSKIMNSVWFDELSLTTRELFFLDLLTNTLSGDTEKQQSILRSKQFSKISVSKQANLWRMVGIDALKNGYDSAQVKYYLAEALKLNPVDRKTRSLSWCLGIGRLIALTFVNIWHFLLKTRKKTVSLGDSRTDHLQRLLGLK